LLLAASLSVCIEVVISMFLSLAHHATVAPSNGRAEQFSLIKTNIRWEQVDYDGFCVCQPPSSSCLVSSHVFDFKAKPSAEVDE
jgi:hypothetical protein